MAEISKKSQRARRFSEKESKISEKVLNLDIARILLIRSDLEIKRRRYDAAEIFLRVLLSIFPRHQQGKSKLMEVYLLKMTDLMNALNKTSELLNEISGKLTQQLVRRFSTNMEKVKCLIESLERIETNRAIIEKIGKTITLNKTLEEHQLIADAEYHNPIK